MVRFSNIWVILGDVVDFGGIVIGIGYVVFVFNGLLVVGVVGG